jgi:hypothetical protein
LVEIWPDLVVFVSISVVLAEIYSRLVLRRLVRRVLMALQALAEGDGGVDAKFVKNADAKFVKNAAGLTLRAVGAILLVQSEDGKWHLMKIARAYGGAVMQAVGELVKIRPAGGPGGQSPLAGLDLGNLDFDQLIGAGISMLPKKYQGAAAIGAALVGPLLKGFGGGAKKTGGSTASSGSAGGENPFLKDLQP